MSPFDSLDAFLISASTAFCRPLVIFVQIQITSLYSGHLKFHFVVESMEDPAYHAINRLLADYEIIRSKDKGPKFTDLGGKRLCGKRGAQPKASVLDSLPRSLTQWCQPKKFDVYELCISKQDLVIVFLFERSMPCNGFGRKEKVPGIFVSHTIFCRPTSD